VGVGKEVGGRSRGVRIGRRVDRNDGVEARALRGVERAVMVVLERGKGVLVHSRSAKERVRPIS